MNTNTVVDMRQFVRAKNGEAFTSSQLVSEAFGKQHKDVLRKIETIECSTDFRERNFTLTHEILMSGAVRRQTPVVEMTKDGFMFLVMGFTGKKAAQIKEGYIEAFNWMAGQLGLSSQDVVTSLISAAELSTLKSVMQDKAKEVEPEKRISFLHTMHHRLHTRFNVPRTEMIQREHFADACNFVAAYALEGEWLPKTEKSGTVLTDSHLYDVYFLSWHFKCLYEIFNDYKLYSHFSGVGSPVGAKMIDHFRDGHAGYHKLQELAPEFEAVQKRMGINQYRGMGVAA